MKKILMVCEAFVAAFLHTSHNCVMIWWTILTSILPIHFDLRHQRTTRIPG